MMDDSDNLAKQPRYLGFLLAAVYVFAVGVAYIVFSALFGVFQAIIPIATVLLGGGFLAMWWYSGPDYNATKKSGQRPRKARGRL